MKKILISLFATLSITAHAKPIDPVKVDSTEVYNYIYLLYLKSDNGAYIPLPMDKGSTEDVKARCKQNDHYQSWKAFVLLNKEFATSKDLNESLQIRDRVITNNLKVVGTSCK
ncbi:hypothetical protein V6C59_20115 [Acinetobacter bereziniae]|uniref:hypothetical protein n=1 Tax=Acinetobacter bereziniae TaxID=106648 RepID=UPI002FD8E701